MIIFSTKHSKEAIIAKLYEQLQQVVFPGIDEAARSQIDAHILWMQRQSGNLHIICRLETFSEAKATVIRTEYTFKEPDNADPFN